MKIIQKDGVRHDDSLCRYTLHILVKGVPADCYVDGAWGCGFRGGIDIIVQWPNNYVMVEFLDTEVTDCAPLVGGLPRVDSWCGGNREKVLFKAVECVEKSQFLPK